MSERDGDGDRKKPSSMQTMQVRLEDLQLTDLEPPVSAASVDAAASPATSRRGPPPLPPESGGSAGPASATAPLSAANGPTAVARTRPRGIVFAAVLGGAVLVGVLVGFVLRSTRSSPASDAAGAGAGDGTASAAAVGPGDTRDTTALAAATASGAAAQPEAGVLTMPVFDLSTPAAPANGGGSGGGGAGH